MLKKCLAVAAVAPLMLGVTSCGDNGDGVRGQEVNWNAEILTLEHHASFQEVLPGENVLASHVQSGFYDQEALDSVFNPLNFFVYDDVLFRKQINDSIELPVEGDEEPEIKILDAHFTVVGPVANLMTTFFVNQMSWAAGAGNRLSPYTILNFAGVDANDVIVNNTFSREEFIDRFEEQLRESFLNTTDLVLPTTVNSFPVIGIEANAFYDSGLRSVNLNNMNYLRNINSNAFANNEIRDLAIIGLEELTTIGESAFLNNNIRTVELTDLTNLTNLPASAFTGNNVTEWTFDTLPALSDAVFGNFIIGMNTIATIRVLNAEGWLSPMMYLELTFEFLYDGVSISLANLGFNVIVRR